MIRMIAAGLWAILVVTGTSVVAIELQLFRKDVKRAEPPPAVIETVTTNMVSVPIVNAQGVSGYVLTRFIVSYKSQQKGKGGPTIQDVVADAAFAAVYKAVAVDFEAASRADLASLTKEIAANVDRKLGAQVIVEVLIKELTFVAKQDARR